MKKALSLILAISLALALCLVFTGCVETGTPSITYGEKYSYEIVGTTEADVELGRISNESPIGNALLGKKEGETVSVKVPTGTITITVKKIG
jgi:transcription elongation factor GreA